VSVRNGLSRHDSSAPRGPVYAWAGAAGFQLPTVPGTKLTDESASRDLPAADCRPAAELGLVSRWEGALKLLARCWRGGRGAGGSATAFHLDRSTG